MRFDYLYLICITSNAIIHLLTWWPVSLYWLWVQFLSSNLYAFDVHSLRISSSLMLSSIGFHFLILQIWFMFQYQDKIIITGYRGKKCWIWHWETWTEIQALSLINCTASIKLCFPWELSFVLCSEKCLVSKDTKYSIIIWISDFQKIHNISFVAKHQVNNIQYLMQKPCFNPEYSNPGELNTQWQNMWRFYEFVHILL